MPYAQAIRQMITNLEERTELSQLRFALSVHRHTAHTHVLLLLHREYTDKQTGEKKMLPRTGLPAEFLNGRDQEGKAQGGLVDLALSDALDTMIPHRRRGQGEAARSAAQTPAQDDNPTTECPKFGQ